MKESLTNVERKRQMVYAPVIIPTCNRIEHLKKCINSLASNEFAKFTEIYISVDFPPSEKYEKGYNEVINYLKGGIGGFKEIFVYIQEKNLGPSENANFLANQIKSYDRWIFTEDDNEFSSNFLEYMDICLQEFEEDESILTVCGFPEGEKITTSIGTAYKSSYFQPYGYGTWRRKWKQYEEEKEKVILDKNKGKMKFQREMYCKNPWLFRVYVNDILYRRRNIFWNEDGKLKSVDGVIQLYIAYSNKYSIFPIKPKARTWGNDGSGYTMEKNEEIDPLKEWILDDDKRFELNLINCESNRAKTPQRGLSAKKYNVKLWIKYIYCRMFKRGTKSWV